MWECTEPYHLSASWQETNIKAFAVNRLAVTRWNSERFYETICAPWDTPWNDPWNELVLHGMLCGWLHGINPFEKNDSLEQSMEQTRAPVELSMEQNNAAWNSPLNQKMLQKLRVTCSSPYARAGTIWGGGYWNQSVTESRSQIIPRHMLKK